MKIGALTYTPYQVLGEHTHKYSSTHVSGGGGSIQGNQWGVHGSTTPVSSTVAHHSEQGIWVRNLETGSENKLNFGTGNNIEVREGHRIVVVTNRKGRRIRTFVVDTGYSFGLDRLYSPWRVSGTEFLVWSLPFALIAMIPYVGPYLLAAMLLARSITGRFEKSDTGSSIVSLVMLSAIAVEWFVFVGVVGAMYGSGDFVPRWLTSHIPLAVVAIAAFLAAWPVIRHTSVKNDATIKKGIEQLSFATTPAAEPDLPLPLLPSRPQQDVSQFFYLDPDNQTKGPVTLNWLQQSRQSGLLAPDTFVAKRGDTEWKSLDSIG